MSEDAKDVIKIVSGVLLGSVVLTFIVAVISFHFENVACEMKSTGLNAETKMVGDAFVHTCFVNAEGKWIDVDNYGMGFTQ